MARRVFFSFEYEYDVWRANVVRNSWVAHGGAMSAGFIDKAAFEQVERKGDRAVREWIQRQMSGTSVTVVLVGSHTCNSKWVSFEIELSKKKGNGLLGIDISEIKGSKGQLSWCCGWQHKPYPFYNWVRDGGYESLGLWIELAALM